MSLGKRKKKYVTVREYDMERVTVSAVLALALALLLLVGTVAL